VEIRPGAPACGRERQGSALLAKKKKEKSRAYSVRNLSKRLVVCTPVFKAAEMPCVGRIRLRKKISRRFRYLL
jgi:hypothetical protein